MKEIKKLEFVLPDSSSWCKKSCFVDTEPSSVLDTVNSSSSSLGSGGASTAAPEKCVTEEWDQEQEPLLRWITGDADDPSMANLSKLLQSGDQAEYEFHGGFLPSSSFPANAPVTPTFPSFLDSSDMKPHIFNLQHQSQHLQSPSFFMPLPYYQSQSLSTPPPAKRHNPGNLGVLETTDHLFKIAELIQTGDSLLAQEILARLNHHLSPIGKSFDRAAFYFKQALQSLLHHATVNPSSPFSLVFKIGAYKSFSEVSPMAQFANFTGSQALLEVLEGFDRIHIVDFDIGYGEQWASLMQELALKSDSTPSLKITALASPLKHEQLELGIIRDNLIQFASEINMGFEFETLGVDHLNSSSWSLPNHLLDSEAAIAVNLPVGWISRNQQVSFHLVLGFVKQLLPKIVVSVERGCDRTDLTFPDHIIHALHSYSNLLESLDAVNVNSDALQKIERFLIQPGIEKTVMARFDSPEKTQHWRALFLSSGFTPFTFSNFAESQAEFVLKRTPVGGFHVEKRHSSLVLCWQRKELISVSAWRC